jgi:thiosulfate/3-mercaptopyruvate sulfurtransferase
MPKNALVRAAVVCVIFQALSLGAATSGTVAPPPLLSHDELQKRLSDQSLRVVDVRPKADYEKGPIPGAVWFDLKAFEPLTKGDAWSDRAAWAKALAPLGVGPGSSVVVYDGDPQHIPAGRVWFFLSYASGDRAIGLVDGIFPVWERANRPVSTEPPTVAPRDYEVTFNPTFIATEADVRSAIGFAGDQIVDARSYDEYVGTGVCPISKQPLPGGRSGHIPSAKLLEASKLVDTDGRFVDTATLRELLSKAGIDEHSPTIVYAKGGARSTATVFNLRRLGIPVRHYVKGLNDWATDTHRPLVKGAEPGRAAE